MVPLGALLRKKECPFEKRVPFEAIVLQGHRFGTLFSLSVHGWQHRIFLYDGRQIAKDVTNLCSDIKGLSKKISPQLSRVY